MGGGALGAGGQPAWLPAILPAASPQAHLRHALSLCVCVCVCTRHSALSLLHQLDDIFVVQVVLEAHPLRT
eukprot:COSAG01_NODE_15148_length_1368_cov_4.442080_1_plen_70_part_10